MNGKRRRWAGTMSLRILAGTAMALAADLNSSAYEAINPRQNTATVHAIINAHGKEITTLPNVVGVYAGLLADQRTECIKVLVIEKDSDTEQQIHNMIKGVPVIIEQTGEITPQNQSKKLK